MPRRDGDTLRVHDDADLLVSRLTTSEGSVFEAAAVLSRDLSTVSVGGRMDKFRENLLPAAAIAISVLSDTVGGVELRFTEKIVVQMDDSRYLIIRPLKGRYLVCLTRPGVRRGLVDIILEYQVGASGKEFGLTSAGPRRTGELRQVVPR